MKKPLKQILGKYLDLVYIIYLSDHYAEIYHLVFSYTGNYLLQAVSLLMCTYTGICF